MSIGLPKTALCQTAGSATITGTVTDPSGSVVPGAAVTIRNTDTGIERKTETSDAGIFTAAFLQPGHYEVQASKTGFTSVLRKDLSLQVGQTLSVNLALAVQSTQAEVTVTGEAPVVDTEKTDVSQVVSDAEVSNLPIAGPALGSVRAAHAPNVTTDGSSGLVSYPRHFGPLQHQQRWTAPTTTRPCFPKGAAARPAAPTCSAWIPCMEYQVSTSNYSAELGQAAGGVVNAVTKSGTNDVAWRPVLLPALSHLERARPVPQVAGQLHPADPPMAAVRGQRGRADHQGQAVLLRNLRRVAQGEPHRLHQQHLQRHHESAAVPGAGDGHAVRQCQCVPVRPAGDIPARHQSGRGFRQAGRPVDAAQPRGGIVRLHELPRAECVPDGAFVQQQLDWQPTAATSTTSASSWRTGIRPSHRRW